VPVLPEKKKIKISLPFYKNLNANTQTGDTNEKQKNLNLNIATDLNLRIKRMKKASLQHCIRAIAGEVVKSKPQHLINFCGGGKVFALKSATALILDRQTVQKPPIFVEKLYDYFA
jgi:hypothetical protein